MSAKISLLATFATAYGVVAFGAGFDLDWCTAYDTDVPYEVEISTNKLAALAGVAAGSCFVVKADGKPLDVQAFKGKMQGTLRLRFRVPAGTKRLICETGTAKLATVDSAGLDNLFAGALKLENLSRWTLPPGVTAKPVAGGLEFRGADASLPRRNFVSYMVDLPPELAGKPAQQEMDVTGLNVLARGSHARICQLDANGRVLPETVVDERWTTHMRPNGKLAQYRDAGHFHREARRLRAEFELRVLNTDFDAHGQPLKDPELRLPRLTVTRLAVRPGALLPFPKYDDANFVPGVTGAAGDHALVSGGPRGNGFFYQTRSRGAWAGTHEFKRESSIYFPAGAGTVEAWFKPSSLNPQSTVLFEAYHGYSRKLRKAGRGVVMQLAFAPKSDTLSLLLVDWKGNRFEKKWSNTGFSLPEGKWTHVALQWTPGGTAEVFCGGRTCATLPLKKFSALPLATEKAPNEKWAMELYVGTSCSQSRLNDGTKDRSGIFQGAIDELRVSSGRRFASDFEPKPSTEITPDTRAFFGFDRSFDGVSGGGFGFVPGSFDSQADRVDHILSLDGRPLQYFPNAVVPANEPRKIFNVYNMPDVPSVQDYRLARRMCHEKAVLSNGGRISVKCPEGSVPDYVEIANNDETECLLCPILVNRGRLDPRSFGDLADSLSLGALTDRDRVNRVFQYALSASDYFMVHPLDFPAGSDVPRDVVFNAMVMLNGYCGFDCGPLNNLAANMFTTVAGCLASQTYGYGHSFEQVFFDGKNHIYDLSAQQFFPAYDNETAAYLEEAANQPGLFNRYRKSGDHFIRKGATREPTAYDPAYQKRIGVALNPGERFRVMYRNDGTANNLHTYARKGAMALNSSSSGLVDYGKVIGADDSNGWVVRRDRIFPQYSTGILTFDGRPSAKSPAVERVESSSFCYRVRCGYPIMWAEYAAELSGGGMAKLEISTDGGQKFRPLPAAADGVSHLEYLVKGRHEYLIRVLAPLKDVKRLSLRTHAMVNLRTYPGWPRPGKNELTFRTDGRGKGEVSVAWREPAQEIDMEGCAYSGAMVGCERAIALMDPAKGLSLPLKGLSLAAKVCARGRISARIEGGRLAIAYAPQNAPYMKHGDDLPQPPREFPAFAAVDILDCGAKRTLTVIVSPSARLLKATEAKTTGKAKLLAADAGSIQPRIMLEKDGDSADFNFERLPKGRYVVFPLVRYVCEGAKIENRSAKVSLMLVTPSQPSTFECSRRINGCEEFLKAPVGRLGERSRWKWDTSSRWDLPGQTRWSGWIVRTYDLPEFGELSFRLQGDLPSGLELAAALVLPDPDAEFLLDAKKLLFGLNCEP